MSNEPKKRMVVVVRTDVEVDGGEGKRQEHPFQAVDDVALNHDLGLLTLKCGPYREVFPLAHVVWWTERPQDAEESRVVPPWERVEGTKGRNN